MITIGFYDRHYLVLFVDDEEYHKLTENCDAMRAAGSSSNQGDSDSAEDSSESAPLNDDRFVCLSDEDVNEIKALIKTRRYARSSTALA